LKYLNQFFPRPRSHRYFRYLLRQSS
jgi:hypothetical protein